VCHRIEDTCVSQDRMLVCHSTTVQRMLVCHRIEAACVSQDRGYLCVTG
jgi:hypothetical protein